MTREEKLAELAEKWRKWGEDPTDYWGDNHGDTADAALLRPRIATAIYRQAAVELHEALALPADAPAANRPLNKVREDDVKRAERQIERCLEAAADGYAKISRGTLLDIHAGFAAVRASTPTLTADDVQEALFSHLKRGTWSEIPSRQEIADEFNAILAAKHKGGDAITNEPTHPRRPLTQDRASTEPVKANACDTPSTAWDRAELWANNVANLIQAEAHDGESLSGELHRIERTLLRFLPEMNPALRGKYEEPKASA